MTNIELICTGCKGKMFHVTLTTKGYLNECWRCGVEILFARALDLPSAKETLHRMDEAVASAKEIVEDNKWHVVITDLDAGGDHDRSGHGMTFLEAMQWMCKWYETHEGLDMSLDQYTTFDMERHPFTGARHMDIHVHQSDLLATLWQD